MVRTEESVSEKTVLLSLHEVSPVFESEVVKACDMLDELGITSVTLLVVPFLGMKMSNSFEKNEMFAEYLKSLGHEISLHGYSHSSKSGSPDEFKGISQERMLSKLKLGVSLFERAFRQPPAGFVPPNWQASQKLASLVRSLGLRYCVIENRIYEQDSRVLSTSERIISMGSGELPLMNAIVEIEVGGPIQVAIHPLDCTQDRLRSLLVDLRDRLGYRFTGYRDYFA